MRTLQAARESSVRGNALGRVSKAKAPRRREMAFQVLKNSAETKKSKQLVFGRLRDIGLGAHAPLLVLPILC
jgi:hypothetical protein